MDLQIYNSTHEELSKNKFPMFIGISINVKPMSIENAESYLKWALEHSSDVVQILIADEIARYNNLVFSHSTKSGALSRAIRDGDQYHDFFEKLLSRFDPEERNHFNIIRWKDILSEQYSTMLQEIKIEFETNEEFRNEILSIQEAYINRRGRELSVAKKYLLSQYLLEELPTLLDGIHVNNKNYSLIFYPTYKHSSMCELVSDIQNKRKYLGLSRRLQSSKTIIVESMIQETSKIADFYPLTHINQ